MITIDQLKDVKDRAEALHRYLDIDAKPYSSRKSSCARRPRDSGTTRSGPRNK